MLLGSSRRLVPSLFVQNPASARPSSVGTLPTEPTATTMFRASSSRGLPSTCTTTLPGPEMRAVPRTGTMPAASYARMCPESSG